jgi:hypothetical protein
VRGRSVRLMCRTGFANARCLRRNDRTLRLADTFPLTPTLSPGRVGAEGAHRRNRTVFAYRGTTPPRTAAVTVPAKPVILSDAFFAEAVCRNCGAALTGPHCAHCGQKKAGRIGAGSVRTEIWEKLRLFELDQLQSALRLVTGPGKVARDYVYGVRKHHTHPLKLLLLAIAVLLVVLAQTRYLASTNVQVTKVMETVRKYAEWSFSLGLAAIWLASMAAFRKRLGYNAVEHLVLALYTHFVIILANIANQLPLLALRSPDWLAWHKQWTSAYMGLVEPAIVIVAFAQFFIVDLRRQWWRLALAVAVFIVAKKLLVYAYAWLLVKFVVARMAG